MTYNSSFKKQEFIHIHGMMKEIAKYVDEEADYGDMEEIEGYQQYLDNDVKPTSIHENKSDHKEAVFLLADSITDFLEGEGQSIKQ